MTRVYFPRSPKNVKTKLALLSCKTNQVITNKKLKIMKKILTLMAAMSAVAGTAMANDFNFANPVANAKEEGSSLQFNEESKAFTLPVTNGDEITLTATGDITVSFGGVELTKKNGKYAVTSDGDLTITLAENAAVTKIFVESSNTRAIQVEIDKAYDEMGKAIAAVAKYVTYEGFYTKVQEAISKAGEKVQAVKAELAEKKEANGVTDDVKNTLIAKLNSTTLIPDYGYGAIKDAQDAVAKANSTFQLFKDITTTEAKKALNKLDKANGTATIAEWNANGGKAINNKALFTHDFTATTDKNGNVTKINLGDFKTNWLKGEWDNLKKEVNVTIKNEAIAELSKFPNAFETNDKDYFVQLYTEVGEKLDNVIARAIFERDNLKSINDLSTKVEKVEAALKAGKPFDLDQDNDYTLLKEQIVSMQNEVKQTDNRYMYSEDQYTTFVTNIAGVSTKLDGFYTELVNKAKADLTAKLEEAQKNLTKYAYEVSAKYENEPDTKLDYQKKFSTQQNNLDKIKKSFENSQFTTVQTDYANFVDQINKLNGEVKKIWEKTLNAQKTEINQHNLEAQNRINGAIEDVRKDYNDYVGWIKNWMVLDATNSASDDLKANLNTLFSEINGLDEMIEKVQKLVEEKTANIQKESDAEFGAHYEANKNLYRITEDVEADYLNQVKDVADKVYDEIVDAALKANAAANTYLTTVDVENAKYLITEAKRNVKPGDKNEKMSNEAVIAFNEAYDLIQTKKQVTNEDGTLTWVGDGFIKTAQDEIARLAAFDGTEEKFKENILANKVGAIREILAKVKPAVETLNGELKSYTTQYSTIYDKKVDWNFAKKDETTLQMTVNDWEKKNNVEAKDHFDVKDALTKANTKLAGALTTLEESCLTASQKEAEIKKVLNEYDADMFKIQNYPTFKANEAAAPIVSAKVTEVEKAIADARKTIEAYEAEIKAEASASLDDVDSQFTNLKSSIDVAVKNNTISANKDGFIAGLDELAGKVADILKKAAEEANGGKLDLNGDGAIDGKDFKQAADNFETTLDSKTFDAFMSKYAEYKKNH